MQPSTTEDYAGQQDQALPEDDKETIAFLHLPKAAGSTLTSILNREYQNIYMIDPARISQSLADLAALPDAKKRQLNLVHGHMPYGVHRHLRQPVKYITMLRDPIERTVSNYSYALRTPQHHMHEYIVGNQLSLMDYVRSGVACDVDNGQTRLVSGLSSIDSQPFGETGVPFGDCDEKMLEVAKSNLRSFAAVGIMESFDESILLMQRVLGWAVPFYRRRNVNHRRNTGQITDVERSVILQHNRFDMELYRHARTMMKNMLTAEIQDVRRSVKRFQLLNRTLGPVKIWVNRFQRLITAKV